MLRYVEGNFQSHLMATHSVVMSFSCQSGVQQAQQVLGPASWSGYVRRKTAEGERHAQLGADFFFCQRITTSVTVITT